MRGPQVTTKPKLISEHGPNWGGPKRDLKTRLGCNTVADHLIFDLANGLKWSMCIVPILHIATTKFLSSRKILLDKTE